MTCSSRVAYLSRSTLVNADSTPPSRYMSPFAKSCLKSALSAPWTSRCCVAAPPNISSSATLSSAAAPDSSLVVSFPSQKWIERANAFPALTVWRQM